MFLVNSVAVFPSYPRESKGQFKLLTASFFPQCPVVKQSRCDKDMLSFMTEVSKSDLRC